MIIECCDCGVIWAVSRYLNNQWKKEGLKKSFYCPNGHGQSYTKSTADYLREELADRNMEISELNIEIRKLKLPKKKKRKKRKASSNKKK